MMKSGLKIICMLGNLIFFYVIAAYLALAIFDDVKWIEYLNDSLPSGAKSNFVMFCYGIIMLVFNIVFKCKAEKEQWDASELVRTNMLMKCIQLPVQLFVFFVAVWGLGTVILTLGLCFIMDSGMTGHKLITIIIVLFFECLGSALMGIFALAGFHNLQKEEKISLNEQTMLSIGSFFGGVDIICAVAGYYKSKI